MNRGALSEKLLSNLKNQIISLQPKQIFADELVYKKKCEDDLYFFMEQAWPQIFSETPFIGNWHLKSYALHLEEVFHGRLKYLIGNMPPRTGKSILLLMFNVWSWINNPHFIFIFCSCDMSLATRDGEYLRMIIQSDWFKKYWGDKIAISTNINRAHQINIMNPKTKVDMGTRLMVSVGTNLVGWGAHIIINDDMNNTDSIHYPRERERVQNYYQNESIRFFPGQPHRMIINQQRLHHMDLTAYVLSKNIPGLVHLRFPMLYEEKNPCVTIPLKNTNGKKWRDPRTKEGELLWPALLDEEYVETQRNSWQSQFLFAGQFQQRPSPEEGGIIKDHWFNVWKHPEPPMCSFILSSWDTGFTTNAESSYSACTVWGVFEQNGQNNIILLSLWKGKLEYPDLKKQMARMYWNIYNISNTSAIKKGVKANVCLVEAKASGLSLIQDLKKSGLMVMPFNPTPYGNKINRVKTTSELIYCGKVWLPAAAPGYHHLIRFADIFKQNCLEFPNSESNDVVDSMSQALTFLRLSGLIDPSSYDLKEENLNPNFIY